MSKIDKDTDFFAYVDNFAKYQHVESVRLYGQHKAVPPKVSITIPTYRRPELLKEAVESAINQDGYEDYEIIIVDNDTTGEFAAQIIEMLKSFASDKVVYYRNQENIGMFGNWNRCIELATGEWMTILNDDDVVSVTYLYKMMFVLQSFSSDVARLECLHKVFGNDGIRFNNIEHNSLFNKLLQNIAVCFQTRMKILKIFKLNFIRYLLGNRSLCMHANLFKVSNAKNIGGFNSDFFPFADFCFNSNYHYQYSNCYQLREILVGYRWAVNESLNPKTITKQIVGFSIFGRYLINLNRSLLLSIFFYRVSLRNFFCYRYTNKKKFSVIFEKLYAVLTKIIY